MKRGPERVDGHQAIIAMFRHGAFASLREAADIVGVSKARVGQWLKADGLDWQTVRASRVAQIWASTIKKRKRRQTKQERRMHTQERVQSYLRKGGKIRRF